MTPADGRIAHRLYSNPIRRACSLTGRLPIREFAPDAISVHAVPMAQRREADDWPTVKRS
jgi:hypothetical protein